LALHPKPLLDNDAARTALALLKERHRRRLAPDESFRLAARVEAPFVVVTLTLANADESLYYPMEARVLIETPGCDDEAACALLCLDFLDFYVGEYLRGDRDVFLTLDWSGVRFGELEVQARGQVVNLKLERMADEFLAAADANGVDP
jgi:hypothetical protein